MKVQEKKVSESVTQKSITELSQNEHKNSEFKSEFEVKKIGATPMMAQFLEIKAEHPDAILFYRMGDFYELFFDDAIKAASILDITLTKRGKHLGEDIPMCGVPVNSHESYLNKLISNGFKVAVCEQVEEASEAKKRGSKSVVKKSSSSKRICFIILMPLGRIIISTRF